MSVSAAQTPTSMEQQFARKTARIAALRDMGPEGRQAAFRRREFSYDDCCLWASLYPHEPPDTEGAMIDDEYVWIAGTTPEVCE